MTKMISKIISTMTAIKHPRKWYDVYLAFVVDKKKEEIYLKRVPRVNEFKDVFPEELPKCHLREKLNLRLSYCRVKHLYLKLYIEWLL